MSRESPIVALKFRRPVDPRQEIWEILRAADGYLTASALASRSGCHIRTVRSYLAALTAAGIAAEKMGQTALMWLLIQDKGAHAPRLRADGSPVTMGSGRAAAWQAMRVLKTFTPRDLHVAAGVPESDVLHYVQYLLKAGYLAVVKPHYTGPKGRATYRLIRDTGPLAPQVTRLKAVFDPNTNTVPWPNEHRGDAEIKVEGRP